MTQKGRKEIEIEEEIKVIRTTCDDCGSRDDYSISQAVFKIIKNLKDSERGYGVEDAVVSFWNDCCPHINEED